jgi:hypothetical protein
LFRDRFLTAARAMVADGWWWTAPHLTDKWIKRRVLRETLATLFGLRRRGEGEREVAAPVEPEPAAQALRIGSGQSVIGS